MTPGLFDKMVKKQEELCKLKVELRKQDNEINKLKTEIKNIEQSSVKKSKIVEWFDAFDKSLFIKDTKKDELLELIKEIKKEL